MNEPVRRKAREALQLALRAEAAAANNSSRSSSDSAGNGELKTISVTIKGGRQR